MFSGVFYGRGSDARRAEAWVEFLGSGQRARPPPARGLRALRSGAKPRSKLIYVRFQPGRSRSHLLSAFLSKKNDSVEPLVIVLVKILARNFWDVQCFKYPKHWNLYWERPQHADSYSADCRWLLCSHTSVRPTQCQMMCSIVRLLVSVAPFPQIDIIGDAVIVWRVRGKTIRSVLCNIVCNNCAQCDAHTYKQTNSSLDWVLSHWAHFTVLDSFLYCVLLCVVYMIA